MSYRRLFVLAFVLALTFAGSSLTPAAGAGYAGYATNIIDGVCYWQCNNGTAGSTPISPPTGKKCLNACAAACGGPCLALY